MRAALVVALLFALPWAGCIGANSTTPHVSGSKGGPGGPPLDNSTVEGVFLQSPHLKVVGSTTIAWNLENGTADKAAVRTTLLWLSDPFKPSFQAVTGVISIVAFIPAEAPPTTADCEAIPKPVHTYYPPINPTGKNQFANLSGIFDKGWYHVVIVSPSDGSFSISFDTQKEGRARNLPGPDPFAGGGAKSVAGGRDLTLEAETPGGVAWVAYGTARIGANSVDGGRDHSLTVVCQTAKGTATGASTNKGFVSVGAVGTANKIALSSSYKPTVAAAATTSTSLEAAWAWSKQPTLSQPTATPK